MRLIGLLSFLLIFLAMSCVSMMPVPTASIAHPTAVPLKASTLAGVSDDDMNLSPEMIALRDKMTAHESATAQLALMSGLSYDDIHKIWQIQNLKGKSVVLVISGLSNYQKNIVKPNMQSLLMDQGFTIIDAALSDTVLSILEEQAGPQYVDTQENLGQWIPADLIAFFEMPIRELYKSIDGVNGKNYWTSDLISIKLIDVTLNTVVSSFTLIGLRSDEQMTESAFINSSVKLLRNSLLI